MDVYLDGQRYRFWFQHYQQDRRGLTAHLTVCYILRVNGKIGTQVGIGSAHQNPKDIYKPEMGRKLALQRALEDGKFNKEQRKLFWHKFTTRTDRYGYTQKGNGQLLQGV